MTENVCMLTAENTKTKLLKSIEGYKLAKAFFDAFSLALPSKGLQKWREEERKAHSTGGTLLEQIYIAQVKKSQCKFCHGLARSYSINLHLSSTYLGPDLSTA